MRRYPPACCRFGISPRRSLFFGGSSLFVVLGWLKTLTGSYLPTPRMLLANHYVMLGALVLFWAMFALVYFFDDPAMPRQA